MSYREDPRWIEAQARFIEPGQNSANENLMARVLAAQDMCEIEMEHEL